MKHKEWRRGDGLEMVILSLSLAGLVCVLSLVAQTLDDYKLASSAAASPNFNKPVQKIQSSFICKYKSQYEHCLSDCFLLQL